MSAYMCSERQLTILAAYAVKHIPEAIPYELRNELECDGFEHSRGAYDRTVGRVFSLLASENLKSLEYRYGSRLTPQERDTSYTPNSPAGKETLPAVHVIKLCHNYAYQACEHPGWTDSVAARLVDAIERHAVRQLPGYDDAPWGL